MLVMIDNYDSFTYNLVQYFGELGQEVNVYRNDQITVDQLSALNPDYLVISPGPCTPNEAGISMEAVSYFSGKIPILGVCLGHQSIAQVFGGKIVHAGQLMHGKVSRITHNGSGVLKDIPSPFTATRYHSLVIQQTSIPDGFEIIAHAEDGEIMAIRHQTQQIHGVQFHPESIETQHGHQILNNFLQCC